MSEYSGIEASDINDKDILDSTKQNRDDKGFISFSYTLSDGHEITSEKFNPEHGRKAIMAWCDTVRSVITQRAQEMSSQKSRKKMVIDEDDATLDMGAPVLAVEPVIKRPKLPAAAPVVATPARAQPLDRGDEADQYVQDRINYHYAQMQKWQRIQGAM